MSGFIQLAFKLSTYLLVLDGAAALMVGGLLSLTGGAVVFVVVAGSWWAEQLRARSSRLPALWRGLALGALGYAALDLLYLAESVLDGFVHLLLFATCYKLYNRNTLRDLRDLRFLSFFMLVAASALTVSLGFFLVLVAFLVLGVWSFMLYHLLTELERYAPTHAGGTPAPEARVPARTAVPSARERGVPSLLGVSLTASALTLVFTLAFFFVIPRIGQAALPFRTRAGSLVSGFSERVVLGAFGSIQTDPTVVMRILFPGRPPTPEVLAGLRWRGVAFDHFTGQEWRVSRPERTPLPRGFDGQFLLAHPRGGRILTQEIYIEPIGIDVLFATPRLLGLTLPAGLALVDPMDSVSFSVRNARLRYLAYSEPEAGSPRDESPDSEAVLEEIRDRYLQLPPLSPRIPVLARDLTRGSGSPYQAAVALTEYLRRNLRYTLDLRRQTELPPVEEFLFVTRAGNCEYFAASLAVLLRSLGIPARVVNGFQRGEWNPYGHYLVVRQRDAHSWVEAYFPGRGWVTLDPSPRAEVDAAFLTGPLFHYLDAIRMRWYRYIVNWSLTDQIAVASAVRDQALDWHRLVSRPRISAEFSTWGRWLGALAAAGVALFVAVRLRRAGVGVEPQQAARSRRRLRAYEEMLKRLARLALTPHPSETAREFASRASRAVPEFGASLQEITEVYERVRFGDETLRPQEEERLLTLAKSLETRRTVKP
jgi:transglutaminase-like putative cysteine protease